MFYMKSSAKILANTGRITRVHGYTKLSQYIKAYRKKLFKISFDMVIMNKT